MNILAPCSPEHVMWRCVIWEVRGYKIQNTDMTMGHFRNLFALAFVRASFKYVTSTPSHHASLSGLPPSQAFLSASAVCERKLAEIASPLCTCEWGRGMQLSGVIEPKCTDFRLKHPATMKNENFQQFCSVFFFLFQPYLTRCFPGDI